MSKKIIYLLSLLMALSLVFASCKKNSLDPNNVGGGNNIEEGDNTANAGDDGLFTDFGSIPTDSKPLITYKVFNLNGTETFRNSVIVPMGKNGNYLAVFSEKRYTSTTADNDIALDGKTVTDIVYNLNTRSGQTNYWLGEKTVGSTAVGKPAESHAAIVVFKTTDTQVVIVASYGVGISRVGTEYASRGTKSGLQYIVGNLQENANTIDFSSGWKDVKIGSQKINEAIESLGFQDTQSPNPVTFAQFGTHSARGVTSADGKKIYVPVVLANQGKTGGATESMGNIILTGTVTGNDVTWDTSLSSAQKVAFDQISTKAGFSKQKESRLYDVTSSGEVKYLTVPNGSAADSDKCLFFGKAGSKPGTTGIKAGDGSPGLVKVKWYGAGEYNVSTYSEENKTPNSMLLMHVKDIESNLNINLISATDFSTSTSVKSAFINQYGKSSSIDVLKDGTIITLAEEGVAEGTAASQRKYNVVFKRYSQAYLASILK